MSQFITVFIDDDMWIKSISVEIVVECQGMPFLGGYLDIETGIKHLHASTQTSQSSQQEIERSQNISKQTQTVETVQKSQQVCKDIFTQTETKYVYSSTDCVNVISPRKPYISADLLEEVKLKSVLTIQGGLRKWLAGHQLQVMKEGIHQHVNWEKIRKQKREEEAKELDRLEKLCYICPRVRKDFDFLFNQLQKWSENELERINKIAWGSERCAALNILTDRHVKRIGEIYTKKMVAHRNIKVDNKLAFLNKAATAKKWKSLNVETSQTLRARELRDLYYTLTLPNLETAERVDALLTVIQIVKEHECDLSNEIISLADREMHLLERRIKQVNLRALHQRIITLFWEYISQPAFNPEATTASTIPQSSVIYKKHFIRCKSCGSYFTRVPLPGKIDYIDTPLYIRTRQKRCPHCIQLENEARKRIDAQMFQRMLDALWKKERHLGVTTGLVYFLKKTDIAYIVEKVWKSRSPISGNTSLKELVLTRWDRYNEWLPWNAILLTHTEADAHDNLNSIEEAYEPEFIKVVKRHLSTAYAYFMALPRLLPHINRSFLQEISFENSYDKNIITTLSDRKEESSENDENVEDEHENISVEENVDDEHEKKSVEGNVEDEHEEDRVEENVEDEHEKVKDSI